MIDPYIILNLTPEEATDELVKERARAIIRENHPDRHPHGLTTEEKEQRTRRFMEAKEAWDNLRTQEDRDNWAKGITKDGVSGFLMELVQDYAHVIMEMSSKNVNMNPNERLKKMYQERVISLTNDKGRLNTTISRMGDNIKKIKANESDPLVRILRSKQQQLSDSVVQIESDIAAAEWKKEFLEKNYEWSGEVPEQVFQTYRTIATSDFKIQW